MNCTNPFLAYLIDNKHYYIDFKKESVNNTLLIGQIKTKKWLNYEQIPKENKGINIYGQYILKNPICVPCGNCKGCLLDRKKQKSKRILQESKLHNYIFFATLTYNNENYKNKIEECKRDLQLFIKRIRKNQVKLRYYAVCEKGNQTKRNHFHIIIWSDEEPKDNEKITTREKLKKYKTIKFINKNWGMGFTTAEQITKKDIAKVGAYVSNYVMKKKENTKLIDYYSKGIGLQAENINYLNEHECDYIEGQIYNIDKRQKSKLNDEKQKKINNKNKKYYLKKYGEKIEIEKIIAENKFKVELNNKKILDNEKI